MLTSVPHKSVVRPIGLAAGTVFGGLALLSILAAYLPQSGLREFFAAACHQRGDRSHWLGDQPVAVCVRCFWLYIGLGIGHLRYTIWPRIPSSRRRFLLVAGVLGGADWLAGWLGVLPNIAVVRASTGFLLGLALANYTLPGLVEWSSTARSRLHLQPHSLSHECVRS